MRGARGVPALALGGALYGLAVLGLMRVFGARRWGLAIAGLLAGPVPAAVLFVSAQTSKEERGGVVFLGCVLGLLLGLLEWNRSARAGEERGDA